MKKITLIALLLTALPTALMAQDCPAASAPYTLDFETAVVPAIPACTMQGPGFGNPWETVNNPGNGFTSIALQLTPSVEPSISWFYSQGVELVAGTSYRMSYRYGNDSATTTERLRSILVNNLDAEITSYIGEHDAITGGVPVEFSFANPITITTTATYYMGFSAYSESGQGNLYLDDIVLQEWVCGVPQTATVDGITTTTATLNWETQTEPTTMGYFYGYSTTDEPPAQDDIRMTTNLTGAFENLTPNTTYYAYVRTMCGGISSDWVSTEFTTLATAGLNDVAFKGFTAYPNPVKNILMLDSAIAIEKIEVYNVTGQLILQQNIQNTNGQINVEKLATGAYLIKAYANGSIKKVRFVKQ